MALIDRESLAKAGRDTTVLWVSGLDAASAAEAIETVRKAIRFPAPDGIGLTAVVHAGDGDSYWVLDEDSLKKGTLVAAADAFAALSLPDDVSVTRLRPARPGIYRRACEGPAVVLRVFPAKDARTKLRVTPTAWVEPVARLIGERARHFVMACECPAPSMGSAGFLAGCASGKSLGDVFEELDEHLRVTSVMGNIWGNLSVGQTFAAGDPDAALALVEELGDLARCEFPGSAYAAVSIEESLERCLYGRGFGRTEWAKQAGAGRVGNMVDEIESIVPDVFPTQILGAGHARLMPSLPEIATHVAHDRWEVRVGTPRQWLDADAAAVARREGWRLLQPLLATEQLLRSIPSEPYLMN